MESKDFFATALMLAVAPSSLLSAELSRNPNVIIILADDLGYGDVGCYGAQKIKTPNLDYLASEGVRFTNAYAPASTSSPSRYALLTGEYAWRKNVGILPADAPLCIDSERMTLPKLMKRNGYRTAIVGKWHLGLGSRNVPVDFNVPIQMGPMEIGFDEAYYFPATNDRVPCIFIENNRVDRWDSNDPIQVSYRGKVGDEPTGKENPERLTLPCHLGHNGTIVNGISRIGWMSGGKKARWKDEEMAQVLSDKAVSFIRKNKKTPFFLYYATHNAHEPRVPSEAFRGKSEAGIYGDVVEEFDYCVGRIVETLKEEGLYENTILIVTSDNAPMIKEGYQDGALENMNGHNPYGNLRGEKYSLHEGGSKVPFIFTWPETVGRPFEQEQPFVFLDLLATLPSLVGISLPEAESNDAKNASDLFLLENAPLYRPYVVTQNNGGDIALRKGQWKYIPSHGSERAELYDLRQDPLELHNVVFAYPKVVKEMQGYVDDLLAVRKKK